MISQSNKEELQQKHQMHKDCVTDSISSQQFLLPARGQNNNGKNNAENAILVLVGEDGFVLGF